MTKYNNSNKDEFIFEQTKLFSFCNGNEHFVHGPFNRRHVLFEYILKHPNCDYILENLNNFLILVGDLSDDKCTRGKELKWIDFLGSDVIDEHMNKYNEYRIPLGYTMIQKRICYITEIPFYTIELFDIFYRNKNMGEFILNKLDEKIDNILPFDIKPNESYWYNLELKTKRISNTIIIMFDNHMIDKKFVDIFIEKNNFKWNTKFINLLSKNIFENEDNIG